MGFGAIIASGSDNAPLSADLADCLIEVRVEQSLDEPTRFGVRVREDFSAGEPMAARAPELQKERILTIGVERDDGVICLVRGPITDSQTQYTLGGPGSWHEVHGSDRRLELGRQCFQHAWEGRASDVAQQILAGYGFDPDIQDTNRSYTRLTQTLNQRGTDLDLLKTAARENGFFFWLSYDMQSAPALGPLGGGLTVTETAHFKTSPFRALGPGGIPPSIASLQLAPTVSPKIRAGTGDECANNVTAFEVREDGERPNTANITAVDQGSLNRDRASANDPQSPLAPDGQLAKDVTGLQRSLCVTAAGNAEEARGRAEAALADAGWFITARASTTAHMLQGVIQPHDVIEVEGIGTQHSIPFRVKKVTHVINAADHFMDIELQSNAHLES